MADQTRCLLGLLLLAVRCVLTEIPDAASSQILDYSYTHPEPVYITTDFGAPADAITASMTVGPKGPILLQDTLLLEVIGNFDHERIPERVVHAKGAGAFGYFEVTHDITKYTRAKVFERIGKRTPVAMRFSTVAGEVGSADTVRDPRGFAIKFYSDDGIWDLVGNNTPIFFVRDPLLFTVFIHSQKRNPATHLKDPTTYWDFISLRPETLHQIVFMFSDRGIPDGHRHMNGYGSHTYKMVNSENEAVYVKFHFKTNQGIKNLPVDVAANLTATDPDYGIRDLYNAIANKKYPSWTLYIQVMTFEQAENFRWNPFDLTKVWPHGEFPLIPVGKLILNKNPTNYFAEVEQIAFNPAHMIPGIEPSPDKMLQARLFSYTDTQRHRLGPNHKQLPVNCPLQQISNYHRDGLMLYKSQGGAPNYHPNSFGGPINKPNPGYSVRFNTTGDVGRYNSKDEDNYSQPRLFWRNVLKPEERDRLVDNIVNHLKFAADPVQERTVKVFSEIDEGFGKRIFEGLQSSRLM